MVPCWRLQQRWDPLLRGCALHMGCSNMLSCCCALCWRCRQAGSFACCQAAGWDYSPIWVTKAIGLLAFTGREVSVLGLSLQAASSEPYVEVKTGNHEMVSRTLHIQAAKVVAAHAASVGDALLGVPLLCSAGEPLACCLLHPASCIPLSHAISFQHRWATPAHLPTCPGADLRALALVCPQAEGIATLAVLAKDDAEATEALVPPVMRRAASGGRGSAAGGGPVALRRHADRAHAQGRRARGRARALGRPRASGALCAHPQHLPAACTSVRRLVLLAGHSGSRRAPCGTMIAMGRLPSNVLLYQCLLARDDKTIFLAMWVQHHSKAWRALSASIAESRPRKAAVLWLLELIRDQHAHVRLHACSTRAMCGARWASWRRRAGSGTPRCCCASCACPTPRPPSAPPARRPASTAPTCPQTQVRLPSPGAITQASHLRMLCKTKEPACASTASGQGTAQAFVILLPDSAVEGAHLLGMVGSAPGTLVAMSAGEGVV